VRVRVHVVFGADLCEMQGDARGLTKSEWQMQEGVQQPIVGAGKGGRLESKSWDWDPSNLAGLSQAARWK